MSAYGIKVGIGAGYHHDCKPCCILSRYAQQQSSLSAHTDLNINSPVQDPASSRQAAGSVLSARAAASTTAASPKPGSRLSSANVASAAKSIINRTPLTNTSAADPRVDDSIIVSNAAGLAVLLSQPGDPAADRASPVNANGIAPGQLGSPIYSTNNGSSKLFNAGQNPSSTTAGGPAFSSSRSVSFVQQQQAAGAHAQLQGNAASHLPGASRPIPHKPGSSTQAAKKAL